MHSPGGSDTQSACADSTMGVHEGGLRAFEAPGDRPPPPTAPRSKARLPRFSRLVPGCPTGVHDPIVPHPRKVLLCLLPSRSPSP
jgi:hypothetical protein